MPAPILLASGRDADVYATEPGRVLRRYRAGGDVAPEAAVMTYVGALGFPVPTVYAAEQTDLVMERLDGPTMAQALAAAELEVAAGARLLAQLHDRLHELPPRCSPDPAAGVLHMDFHPDNVMLTRRGPVVIDWRNAIEGPPDLDVAMTALILAQVVVAGDDPRGAVVSQFPTAFLAEVGKAPLGQLESAVAIRAGDRNLSAAESNQLDSAAALVAAE